MEHNPVVKYRPSEEMKVKYSGDFSRNAFLKTLDSSSAPMRSRPPPSKVANLVGKLENSEIKYTSCSAGVGRTEAKQSIHLKSD